MLKVGTFAYVQDNFGIKKVKCIRVPKVGYAKLGSIVLVSVVERSPYRSRIRYGQLFRAVVVGLSNISSRRSGIFIKSFNSVLILKKSEDVLASRRIKGPVCAELRYLKLAKVLSMSSFVY